MFQPSKYLINFHFIPAGYVAVIGDLVVSTNETHNGSDISITCNVATIGYPSDTTFQFKWTLDGVNINPTSLSRFTIVNTEDRDFPELKRSVLRIEPITAEYAGK